MRLSILSLLIIAGRAAAEEPPTTAIVFAPQGKSLVATSQLGWREYSWPELKLQRTKKTTAANLHCLAFSADGKRLAVGGGHPAEEGIVEVFSWPAGESLATFNDHADSVRDVVWKSGAQLLTASIDHDIRLWDVTERRASRTFQGHSRSVSSLCLLNDGKILVSAGDDQSVRVWDAETGKVIRTLSQHTKPIHAMAVRPATEGLPMIATAAGDRTVRLWQPTIGRMVRYARLASEPLDIVWTNDGTAIIAACIDGRIRVVNADEVKVTQTLPAIEGWAYTVAVPPGDERSVVVGGSNGALRRVELKTK